MVATIMGLIQDNCGDIVDVFCLPFTAFFVAGTL